MKSIYSLSELVDGFIKPGQTKDFVLESKFLLPLLRGA